MYIQPYEPQQSSFAAPLGRRGFGEASCPSDSSTSEASLGDDSVSQSAPWSQMLSGVGDAAGALEDGPLGMFGLGGMLTSLTSMMQQLTQMMQALLARANGSGDEPGTQPNPAQTTGHHRSHRAGEGMGGGGCGCTQQAQGAQSPIDGN